MIIRKMTTRQITEAALAKREDDIRSLKAKGRSAVAMFHTMKDQLEKTNAALEEIVMDLNTQIEALTAQKMAAEQAIDENSAVCQSIAGLIGE